MNMERRNITDWSEFLEKSSKVFKEKYFRKGGSLLAISDFTIVRPLGFGAYGRVVLAKHNEYGKHYAMKILKKAKVVASVQVQHTLDEKRILQAIDFHFIVRSEHFFMDNCYLYIAMPYEVGWEMFVILRSLQKFSEETAAFYAAQIVLALEYLHFLQVAYRDLKPENILVCADGYIKVTDLGYAKIIKSRTYTMCGTIEYLAPEIIGLRGHGLAVDWWCLGVLIYEMCVGKSPFFRKQEEKIFEAIEEGHYDDSPLESRSAKELVRRLLEVRPTKRLGNAGNGVADVKNHPWFVAIDWMKVVNKQVDPPIKPCTYGLEDSPNYNSLEVVPLEVCHDDDTYHELFAHF